MKTLQTRILANQIVAALLADEQDGGYDLTAGMFGTRFSELVAKLANQNIPKIGEYSEIHDGIYAGIACGENGEPDCHIFRIDAKSPVDQLWLEAMKWATTFGNGSRLASRSETAVLLANLRPIVEPLGNCWTSTGYGLEKAIMQFTEGLQDDCEKNIGVTTAHAIRRVAI